MKNLVRPTTGRPNLRAVVRFALAIAIVTICSSRSIDAQEIICCEPGWTGVIVKRGLDKEISDATPILQRPYRPLHFYGNTVRRQYYRGNPFPTPADMADAVHAWIYHRGW